MTSDRTQTPEGRDGESREGDYDLIRRAQAGEERAFELLVRRFERRAWRVARNMLPTDEDAQDIAQEAFLRVFRNLERFDFKHEFSTWLYRIVTNLAIDFLRRRRPAVSTSGLLGEDDDLDLVDENAVSPSAGLEQVDTAREVHACLAALPEHFRSVMVLRELEGLSCIRIAEIVGATHVTVRWRLHRGRKLFQEEWERRARLATLGNGQGLADGANTAKGEA
ncbi:MAG TPA: sigma-70 family RNA polymerase sigma factor [Planctomycetota bacterium]|jgi:RNA polymerase sigma-70 factor (ECF subfamily)|nr:sigma-70 family RNA polymerase sigma factor [Planctomycetota bacterium]